MQAAGRAKGYPVRHHQSPAATTVAESEFITARQCGDQVHRVFEAYAVCGHQLLVDLECLAEQLAAREVGQGPLIKLGSRLRQHAQQGTHTCQERAFFLEFRRACEVRALLRRAPARPRHRAARLLHVAAIELADAIVREAGPRPYGLRARLVLDEAQGEIETEPVAAVAVVGDAHGPPLRERSCNFWPNSPRIARAGFDIKIAIIPLTNQGDCDEYIRA